MEELNALEKFGAYIKYAMDADKADYIEALVEYGEEVIALTEPLLRKATQDEILIQQQKSREKWERDKATLIHIWETRGLEQGLQQGLEQGMRQGMEQGMRQGMKEGEAQGREQKALQTAWNLKAEGIDMEVILRATGISREVLGNL